MATALGVNQVTIKGSLKYLNLIAPKINFRKAVFNENYFETINTKDKAYFLGLLYADGNIYKTLPTLKHKKVRKRLQIFLNAEDKYILELFSNYLDYKGKLYKDRKGYRFLIHNDKIVSDLENLGICERKSLILKFPTEEQVPSHLIHHFIRGYFDGDGCISIDNRCKNLRATVNFTGTSQFLLKISEFFIAKNIKASKFYIRYKNMPTSAGTINFYLSKNKNTEIYKYIYEDKSDLFMSRKHDKFLNFIL